MYSEDRIRNGVKRILKSRQGATQGRLDTFFKPIATATAGVKRKVCTHVLNILNKSTTSLPDIYTPKSPPLQYYFTIFCGFL